MNAALASGKNLLLGPGTYVLDAPLTIAKPDKVVMGLGDPVLRADNTATARGQKLGSEYGALQVQRRWPRVRPGRHGTVRHDQVVIGDTPHGVGSRNDPTALTDVSSVSGPPTGSCSIRTTRS
jgi:hypothetical protein